MLPTVAQHHFCLRRTWLSPFHQSIFEFSVLKNVCPTPANGLKLLSAAGPDSQEVVREAEVWRDNADCSLAPGV